jgi:hypothetical protein
MSDQDHKPLPKIRTFALDQAHARGDVTEPEKKTVVAPEPILITSDKEVKKPAPIIEAPIVVKEKPVPQPPAFHELLKSHTPHATPTPPTKQPRAAVTVRTPVKPPAPRNTIHATDAVVISSGKKTEFNLFKELAKGISLWWKELTTSKDTTPSYTVRDTIERKPIIEKATTKTGAAIVGAPATLKESIAKRREEVPPKNDVTWSPHTEPGFALLPEQVPAATPPVIVYKQKSVPNKESASEKAEPTRRFVPPSDAGAESGFGKEPEIIKFSPPPPAPPVPTPPVQPKYSIEPEPLQEPSHPAPVAPVAISIPKTPNPPSSYLKNGLRKLVRVDTTVTTVLIAGTVVSFVLMFFIVRTIFAIIAPAETAVDVATRSSREAILTSATVSDVALGEVSTQGFIQSFRAMPRPSQGVVEYQPTTPAGDVIPPAILWNTFGFDTNPNFIQAVKILRIGYVDGQLLIVMEVSDPTTVFGSLLAWEDTMYQELSTLFGLPVTRVATVRDETIGTSDIRVLESENGQELAAYGFIGNDTVVISTTAQTFTKLTQ